MKKILAIESSCDETACAILDVNYNILSNVVTSQIDIHKRFGGVIPEVASRMHIEQISIVIKQALSDANLTMDDIDYIAYTRGPGLIGSLHIGGIAAKTLAFFYKKPLIAVNHLKGHIFVNQLVKPLIYPLLAVVVSGGHTELVYMENDDSFKIIGTTKDDAIGEAYDKVARILNLEYPGGPKIDALAKKGKHSYKLPIPKVDGYNFSFSGLKNATLQLINRLEKNNETLISEDLACSFQETALKTLVDKTVNAIENLKVKQVVLAGGVACNSRLRALVEEKIGTICDLILPPLKYTTDNATMIACAAIKEYEKNRFARLDLASLPSMSIDD